jgi:hypothetical protein
MDSHLDDGPPDRVITPDVVNLLYGMVRSVAWLSHVYARPLMLWTSANAWGLKRTGGPEEALENLSIVENTSKQVGGELGMLLAWGWNIYRQGIFDDEGVFLADKDTMIRVVGQALASTRDDLTAAGPPVLNSVIHVPSPALYTIIGQRRYSHLADTAVDLSGVDFGSDSIIYVVDGRALEASRAIGAREIPCVLDTSLDPPMLRPQLEG